LRETTSRSSHPTAADEFDGWLADLDEDGLVEVIAKVDALHDEHLER
jgi:hypothetical protein